MKCGEAIGFSYAVAYCKKCGKIEGYNGNRPFNMPDKCRFCGGDMTTKQIEDFLNFMYEAEEEAIEYRKKVKEIEDKIKLLEKIRDMFSTDCEYTGREIRYRINKMIEKEEIKCQKI